jgi:Phospholipase D-like domain at C-terminus of MIT
MLLVVICCSRNYIRIFYQVRNFMEFIETVVKHKPMEEEVAVHLITTEDEFKGEQQKPRCYASGLPLSKEN